jgi:hypothetical protein
VLPCIYQTSDFSIVLLYSVCNANIIQVWSKTDKLKLGRYVDYVDGVSLDFCLVRQHGPATTLVQKHLLERATCSAQKHYK